MPLPKDIQFTDNDAVNIFAEGRATLLFGSNWKNRNDLMFSQPERNAIVVCGFGGDEDASWGLEVKTTEATARYSVCCMKKGKLQDPETNLAAAVLFYASGKPRRQTHYTAGFVTNPPDGTPAKIGYKENGDVWDGWYMDEDGRGSSATEIGKVNERIRVAKNLNLRELCAGESEIVALKSGSISQQNSQGDKSAGVTANLRA